MSDNEVSDDSVSSEEEVPKKKSLAVLVKNAIKSFAPFEEIMELFHRAYDETETIKLLREVRSMTLTKIKIPKLHAYVIQTQQRLFETLVRENPEYLTELVNLASGYQSIVLLDLLYQYASDNCIDFPVPQENINSGTDVNFLEWWKDKLPSNYQLFYRCETAEIEDVTRWWVKSGFQITFDEESISDPDYSLDPKTIRILHEASVHIPFEIIEKSLFSIADGNSLIFERETGNTQEALDWLFQEYGEMIAEFLMKEENDFYPKCIMDTSEESYLLMKYVHAKGIPFYYTEALVDNLSNMDQAMFWETSGLPIKHTQEGLLVCLERDIDLARWWLRNRLDHAESYCVDDLIKKCATEPIQLLIDNGISVTCTEDGLDFLRITHSSNEEYIIKMLQFLMDSGLGIKYGELFIDKCLKLCMFEVLDYLFNYGLLPAEKDFADLVRGTSREHKMIHAMLSWWVLHDLKLIMSEEFVDRIRKIPEVVKLLEEHGYVIPAKVTKKKTKK